MTTIVNGKVAYVTYTGTYPDSGEIFDSNVESEPLPFLVGHGNMIEGFEQELLGAAEGETRSFTLTPERAYGFRVMNRQFKRFLVGSFQQMSS